MKKNKAKNYTRYDIKIQKGKIHEKKRYNRKQNYNAVR